MASNREPRGKIVRRLGVNVFGNPKYDRLLARKPHKPGKAPGARPRKVSEFGLQLAEKGLYRAAYGLGERRFHALWREAGRAAGSTGEAMLSRLESGLANLVFRLGWAPSRAAARQLVGHGQVFVNGRRLDIPGARLRPGDRLELRAPESLRRAALAGIDRKGPLPSFLERGKEGLEARLLAAPEASEASVRGRISLVVEYYAR